MINYYKSSVENSFVNWRENNAVDISFTINDRATCIIRKVSWSRVATKKPPMKSQCKSTQHGCSDLQRPLMFKNWVFYFYIEVF